MPLRKAGLRRRSLGARNDDYCAYCYKDGAFVARNMTMKQMRDLCIDRWSSST